MYRLSYDARNDVDCIAGEGSYGLTLGPVGNHVALVASEPITGSTAEWVPVPAGTALVISRERNGYINIMHSPLDASQGLKRMQEVARWEIQSPMVGQAQARCLFAKCDLRLFLLCMSRPQLPSHSIQKQGMVQRTPSWPAVALCQALLCFASAQPADALVGPIFVRYIYWHPSVQSVQLDSWLLAQLCAFDVNARAGSKSFVH